MNLEVMTRTALLRAGIGVMLAVSGLVHADLYLHGYRYVPTVGAAFLAQGSLLVALAILVMAGAPRWLVAVAGLASAASLAAFALSRTVGLAGFVEHGWQPSPQAVVSVVTEVLAVVLCTAVVLRGRA